MTKIAGKYKHVHEDALKSVQQGLFSIEDMMPIDHPVRRSLYRLRCELGTIIMLNRENPDYPQARWVLDAPEASE